MSASSVAPERRTRARKRLAIDKPIVPIVYAVEPDSSGFCTIDGAARAASSVAAAVRKMPQS